MIAAAKANKAIFCEKPLSVSLAEALDIQNTVDQTGAFFYMGFMRRRDPGYVAAKQKIDAGEIGEPVLFKASSRGPFRPSLEYANPQISGGLFVDMGIHDFDLARWLVGEVRTVFSIGGTLAYPEMHSINEIDNGVTNLVFEDGKLGVVDLSRNGVYGYDIRNEILGTKGTIKIGYLRETPIVMMTKAGITHDTVPYFMERFEKAYIAQLADFIDCLLNEREPSISCADGVESLRVAIAARESYQIARPVAVKEISTQGDRHEHHG